MAQLMKFGQLTLRKIIKIVAARYQILRLKCTKFNFGRGSAPDPAGGAYSAPPDPLGGPTSKGRGQEGKGMGWEGEGRGAEGMRLYPFTASLIHIYGYAPDWLINCFDISLYTSMPLLGYTGCRGHNVLNLCIRSFFCYQTCEHDILKMNEPILMEVVQVARAWNGQVWW